MLDPINTLISWASLIISGLSFFISAITVWFTLLKRGRLAMTKPTIVSFSYDKVPGYDNIPEYLPKIFLRTLLYSTAVRSQVVEDMFIRVLCDRTEQIFSFWGYGETNILVRGSGLNVEKAGVSYNHHFNPLNATPAYNFKKGNYTLLVFARLTGQATPVKLSQIEILVTDDHAAALARRDSVLFDLDPATQNYIGHVS